MTYYPSPAEILHLLLIATRSVEQEAGAEKILNQHAFPPSVHDLAKLMRKELLLADTPLSFVVLLGTRSVITRRLTPGSIVRLRFVFATGTYIMLTCLCDHDSQGIPKKPQPQELAYFSYYLKRVPESLWLIEEEQFSARLSLV
jgi:hypothetical protein